MNVKIKAIINEIRFRVMGPLNKRVTLDIQYYDGELLVHDIFLMSFFPSNTLTTNGFVTNPEIP